MKEEDFSSDVAKDLSAAFDKVEGAALEVEPVEAPAEPELPPIEGADIPKDEPTEKADRARDDTGKFVKAEAKEPKTEKPDAKPAELKPADNFSVTEAILKNDWSKVDLSRPPSGLSIEAKAQFAQLPEWARKEFLLRDARFHKGIEEYKGSHTNWRQLQETVNPYTPRLQALGVSIPQALQSFLQFDYQLQTNPSAVINSLAQRYNVNLQQPQQQVDPQIAQLQQQLAQLQQRDRDREQLGQQQIRNQALSEVAKVQNDPANIYFEEVKPIMAALIQSGAAANAQDAYKQACRAHPQVSQAILQQEAQANEAKRIEEAKLRAANAKRAAFDVSGSGASTVGREEMTLRQRLESLIPD